LTLTQETFACSEDCNEAQSGQSSEAMWRSQGPPPQRAVKRSEVSTIRISGWDRDVP